MEYISPNDLEAEFVSAINESVYRNIVEPIRELLPRLDSPQIFDESLIVFPIGIGGDLSTHKGRFPVTQILGKALYDNTVLSDLYKRRMPNPKSGVRIYRSVRGITVSYRMQESRAATRYLSKFHQVYSCAEEGVLTAYWSIDASDENREGTAEVAGNILDALLIYNKLITRLPLCPVYSNVFPTFQSSSTQRTSL